MWLPRPMCGFTSWSRMGMRLTNTYSCRLFQSLWRFKINAFQQRIRLLFFSSKACKISISPITALTLKQRRRTIYKKSLPPATNPGWRVPLKPITTGLYFCFYSDWAIPCLAIHSLFLQLLWRRGSTVPGSTHSRSVRLLSDLDRRHSANKLIYVWILSSLRLMQDRKRMHLWLNTKCPLIVPLLANPPIWHHFIFHFSKQSPCEWLFGGNDFWRCGSGEM